MGECNKACSPCDTNGNFVGKGCGVGCDSNPANGTCAVNHLAGPCSSPTMCGSNSAIFGDKLVPNFGETQMQYQFRRVGCPPMIGLRSLIVMPTQSVPVQRMSVPVIESNEEMIVDEIDVSSVKPKRLSQMQIQTQTAKKVPTPKSAANQEIQPVRWTTPKR